MTVDEPAVQLRNFGESVCCFLVIGIFFNLDQLKYKLSTCKAGDRKVITHNNIRLHKMMLAPRTIAFEGR